MRFQTLISELKTAQQVIVIVVVIAIVSITTNLLLSCLAWRMLKQASVYIVPAHITAPFKVSQLSVDGNYLQQMTLGFLNERLNVTPETVDASHQLLLQSVSPRYYHAIVTTLNHEASNIKQGNISSVFYLHHYAVNPHTLTVTVSGTERWWFGEKKMSDQSKTYQLQYRWQQGRLVIVTFALATPTLGGK